MILLWIFGGETELIGNYVAVENVLIYARLVTHVMWANGIIELFISERQSSLEFFDNSRVTFWIKI